MASRRERMMIVLVMRAKTKILTRRATYLIHRKTGAIKKERKEEMEFKVMRMTLILDLHQARSQLMMDSLKRKEQSPLVTCN